MMVVAVLRGGSATAGLVVFAVVIVVPVPCLFPLLLSFAW